MKTAKPPPAPAAESSRRSQPVRQTRTNPARSGIGRAPAHRDRAGGPSANEQPIDIFPAIMHFTDTITDLPQALARHFTLLREVDAKVHAPEQILFQLIHEALALPPVDASRSASDGASSVAPGSAPMSAQNSANGVVPSDRQADVAVADGASQAVPYHPSNLPRRQLFRQIGIKIQEMLVSLEEKNHVISTANNELSKRQTRIKGLWGALENEFSEEARNGSSNHWAYAENRAGRAINPPPTDRPRRDGGTLPPSAPQPAAEEAASRSDARKQAVAARKEKTSKTQPTHESDADDRDARQKPEPNKKTQTGAKSRKPAQAATSEAATPVGLGITAPSPANGNPAPKRRKVEKPTNGSAPLERALSSVFGDSAPKQKTMSPRETPVPENPSKKRKALPSSGNQAKKSRNGSTNSPSVASSPVIGAFPEPVRVIRNSPVPIPTPRAVAAARAKPVTASPAIANGKPPPPVAAPNKPNGVVAPTPADPPVQTNGARPSPSISGETKPVKEAPAPKSEVPKPEVIESTSAIPLPIIPTMQRKDPPIPIIKPEATRETRKETPPSTQPATAPGSGAAAAILGAIATTTTTLTTSVATKSGRASKPSTPALGNFPDSARARSSRAGDGANPGAVKRSHKKGASSIAMASGALAAEVGPGSGGINKKRTGNDNGDKGQQEEKYCYCDRPSFGSMIACDADGCQREWFHYECVGLKAAPKENVKWYCRDCRKRLFPEKKSNGTI